MRDITNKPQVACTLDGARMPYRLSEPKVNVVMCGEEREIAIQKGAAFIELTLTEFKDIWPTLNAINELFIKMEREK
jgi:hypothetical protein